MTEQKFPKFENREELPLVDVTSIDHGLATEQEFIRYTLTELYPPGTDASIVDTILAACEEWYHNGFAEEVSGDVDAPTGHFYRVNRWIVLTDSQGFQDVFPFDTTEEAEKAFDTLDKEYGEWLGEEDE